MFGRVQIFAVVGSLVLLGLIVELIRKRHLKEEYSLLWLLTGMTVLVFALWRDLLTIMAGLMGIAYPPSALFLLGVLFFLQILLHFSVVVSKLTDRNRDLAERLALLDWKIRELEHRKGKPGWGEQ